MHRPTSFRRVVLVPIALAAIASISAESSRAAIKSTGVPQFDAAVRKAVGFLKGQAIKERDKTLVAYALLKAGLEKTEEHISEGLNVAQSRAAASGYRGYDHLYLAGVDAMLLSDADADKYAVELQNIADYVQSVQRPDGSFSDSSSAPGDVSMTQYGVLALWAAQRANCDVRPDVIEKAAAWLTKNGNGDGGWGYRPGTKSGPGRGSSTHNMTLAAAGTVAIGRTLLYGRPGDKKEVVQDKFGILKKVETEAEKRARANVAFPDYSPGISRNILDSKVQGGIGWNQAHFQPVSQQDHKIYFYYALERASAMAQLPDGWFQAYGNGLVTLQGADGSFKTHNVPGVNVGTSFAILYFVRSTKQILDKQFGTGIMRGGRDLASLYGEKKKEKKDIGPLDALLREMENVDFSSLDDIDTEDFTDKITNTSREELVGQIDLLRKLVEHPEASNRQAAYYALGRTGDFSLIPEILKGLRDPNLDVNVEALNALRYISRKPNGFGLSLNPIAGAETSDADRKLIVANVWRNKAWNAWASWYRRVRPYNEGGGLDEIELLGKP